MLAEEICGICGRKLDESELSAPDEKANEEDECLHCHFCMYEDCHVFLDRPRRLCARCREEGRRDTATH